jgi:hypothetical protein
MPVYDIHLQVAVDPHNNNQDELAWALVTAIQMLTLKRKAPQYKFLTFTKDGVDYPFSKEALEAQQKEDLRKQRKLAEERRCQARMALEKAELEYRHLGGG